MNLDLKKISRPVENELEEFRIEFRKSIKSKVALVELISKYILRQKGKKIRPILVLLSAKLCGNINPRSYIAATLVEMLHTATLVHDDIIDNADTRRNRTSVNARFGNQAAVLMGDWLYMSAFETSLKERSLEILDILTRLTRKMTDTFPRPKELARIAKPVAELLRKAIRDPGFTHDTVKSTLELLSFFSALIAVLTTSVIMPPLGSDASVKGA